MGFAFPVAGGAPYSCRHVLDHADQAPRSGSLPRALSHVSNVLRVPSAHSAHLVFPRCRPGRLAHSAHLPVPDPGHSMPSLIDSRGPQFAAALTSVVLAVVLATSPSSFATVLLGFQAVLFAVGATLGVQRT